MDNDELWLKQLKERLDNHSLPVPPDGWERLEKELSSGRMRKPVIPLWRRLAVAASLLAAVVATGWWIGFGPGAESLQTEVQPHAVTATHLYPDPLPPVASPQCAVRVIPTVTRPASRRDFTATVSASSSSAATVIQASTSTEQADSSTVTPSSAPDKSEARPRKKVLPEASSPRHNRVYRPKTADRRGWALALAVGNSGGIRSSSGASQYPMADFFPDDMISGNQTDFSSMTNTLMAIPEGQELVFKNGMPYLQPRRKRIASIDHKPPVSVGFLVRKRLPHRFSIETGLTYTYLASDVQFEGETASVRQKLHYLGIPVRANWNMVERQAFVLYLSAGGAVEKCVYGRIGDEKSTVDPVQLSVTGAVGAQYNLNRRMGLYLEPGVSYYFDDGSVVETIRKEHPCNFTIQAGFRISY